jgi:hypothetical protein
MDAFPTFVKQSTSNSEHGTENKSKKQHVLQYMYVKLVAESTASWNPVSVHVNFLFVHLLT